MSLKLFTICASLAVATGQFQSCDMIHGLNCSQFADQPTCATDGITYSNKCYFAKAQCIDKFLHVYHEGACLPFEASTTPSPGQDGEEAILDFFCTALSHKDCGTDDKPVCASDGWTYTNYCEYDKQRCTHRDITIVSYGVCPTRSY